MGIFPDSIVDTNESELISISIGLESVVEFFSLSYFSAKSTELLQSFSRSLHLSQIELNKTQLTVPACPHGSSRHRQDYQH